MTKTRKYVYLAVFVGVLVLATVAFGISQANCAYAAELNLSEGAAVAADVYEWREDGKVISDNILSLSRGSKSGVLTFWHNGVQVTGGKLQVVNQSTNYVTVISNALVEVKYNTPLTYGSGDYQYLAYVSSDGTTMLSEQLLIRVLPRGPITLDSDVDKVNPYYLYKYTINNLDIQSFSSVTEKVSINFSITNYQNETEYQTISVTSNSSYSSTLTGLTGYYRSKTLTLSIESVTYSYLNKSVTYKPGVYKGLFGKYSEEFDGYFSGGDGSSAHPYLIYNYDELDHIRDATTYVNGSYKITSNFLLMSNIDLGGDWTPIPYQFDGTLSGNDKTIDNLRVMASGNGGNLGLFTTIGSEGRVSNITFTHVNFNHFVVDAASYNVGVVAGTNNGTIQNCDLVGIGTILFNLYNINLGGIAGVNYGKISDCDIKVNNDNHEDIRLKSSGIMGGIVGLNAGSGSVSNCTNNGQIEYYYDTQNGCAAGIVGKNTGSATVTGCTNKGNIKYGSEKIADKAIAPCMAQIIGWLVNGTYSYNNTYGDVNTGTLTKVGTWPFQTNQARYCSNGIIGRNGE